VVGFYEHDVILGSHKSREFHGRGTNWWRDIAVVRRFQGVPISNSCWCSDILTDLSWVFWVHRIKNLEIYGKRSFRHPSS